MATSYSPKIPTTNLVCALDPLNHKSYNGSGTTVEDVSGTGNFAILANGMTFESGSFKCINTSPIPCLNINSITDDIATTSRLSVLLWMRPNGTDITTGSKVSFFRLGDLPSTNDVNLQYGSIRGIGGDYLLGAFYNSINQWVIVSSSAMQFPANTWTHLAFSLDRSSGFSSVLNIYVNGVSVGYSEFFSVNNRGTIPALSASVGGNPQDADGVAANISIGLVSVYNKVFTRLEVSQHYNALRSRFGV